MSFRIFGFILIFAVFFVSFVQSLVCNDCDVELCEEPKDCPGPKILDFCKCCEVCARIENETCGGPFNAFGGCGEDLYCYGAGETLDTLVGVCKPKSFKGPLESSNNTADITGNGINDYEVDPCAGVRCQVVFAPRCPSDSKSIGGEIEPGECCPTPAKCVCNYVECLNPACSPGYAKVTTKKGTGLPGNCCDIYECRPINDPCDKVECEDPDPDLVCPSDSFRLPSIPSADGCCLMKQGCTCRPSTVCTAPSCAEGLKVRILEAATGKPGKCCDKFKCYNGTLRTCDHESQRYLDGESYKIDKCTTCVCQDGATLCKTEVCEDTPLCSWMEVPEGGCCPVCIGCLSTNGDAYKNGERWNEGNDCVHCRCVDNRVYCQAEMCAVHCSRPRKVPGQCCPVCDEPELMTIAPHCPSMDNCTLLCAAGWDRDMNGCLTCRCRPAKCQLRCPYGYKIDHEGNQVCDCEAPPPGCLTLKKCTKTCMYGYRRGKNNCLKCRCNKCPFFSCPKTCPYGFENNDEGCQICKCVDNSTTTAATTAIETSYLITQRPSISPHMCLSSEGRVFDDGESWYDGCRHCYCHIGREMCALITCPSVNCINPIMRVGDCCPSCPGDPDNVPSPTSEKCFSSKGQLKAEGETWAMDDCTRCICHNSNILCEMERCQPLPCKQPVRLPGMCCPICPEDETSLEPHPSTNKSCHSLSGGSYKHGDTWKTNPCMSCTCRHGQIHCFSQTCPIVSCNQTVFRKGQCCPACFEPEAKDSGKCTYHETLYDSGERWNPQPCKRCRCHKGKVKCNEKVCAAMDDCLVSHTPPGECCPVCSDNNNGIQMTIVAILVTIIAVLTLLVLALFIVCIRRRNRHSVDIDSVPKSRSADRNIAKRPRRDDKPTRRPPASTNVDLQGVLDSSQPDIISVKGMDSYKLCMDDSGRHEHRERGGTTTFISDKEYVEDSKRKLPDKYKSEAESVAIVHMKKNQNPHKSSEV